MTDPKPATRQHDPRCPGCREYAVLLGRETTARAQFYDAGRTAADAVQDLRSRLVAYLKRRHPLRTEELKQRGQPLGPDTDASVLLGALAQWDQMRDAVLRAEIARSVEDELTTLRTRNAELEQQSTAVALERHREDELYLERIRGLTEQVNGLTARLSEAGNDRRELSRAVGRLADQITAGGGALPALLHTHDWYRQWAGRDSAARPPATDRPDARRPKHIEAAKPASTSEHHRPLLDRYDADWGEALLRRLWAGSTWTRQQIAHEGTREKAEVFIDELVEHGMLTVTDSEQTQILAVTDKLGTFARDVGAQLGPRKPSPAARVAEAMTALDPAVRIGVLRAMAAAGRDHHLTTVHCPSDRLPLLGVRPRTGPRMPARWLLPWLPDHTDLAIELLGRARDRDSDAGLAIVVRRQGDGADNAEWGEPVRAAGFEPASVKRIWLSP